MPQVLKLANHWQNHKTPAFYNVIFVESPENHSDFANNVNFYPTEVTSSPVLNEEILNDNIVTIYNGELSTIDEQSLKDTLPITSEKKSSSAIVARSFQ